MPGCNSCKICNTDQNAEVTEEGHGRCCRSGSPEGQEGRQSCSAVSGSACHMLQSGKMPINCMQHWHAVLWVLAGELQSSVAAWRLHAMQADLSQQLCCTDAEHNGAPLGSTCFMLCSYKARVRRG